MAGQVPFAYKELKKKLKSLRLATPPPAPRGARGSSRTQVRMGKRVAAEAFSLERHRTPEAL